MQLKPFCTSVCIHLKTNYFFFLTGQKQIIYDIMAVLVFKNKFSLFPHINQNCNVLLYKSFNKFPSDTKITNMFHRHAHAHTQAHLYTKEKKPQNAPFMIWHFGHMEQFALICWFGWPCSAIIAMFLNNDIPFPLGGPLSPTQGPGYKYSEVEFTSTGHMNTGTHTQSYGRKMRVLS